MSQPNTATPIEQTFHSYTSDQSSNYASYRPGYPPELFQHILQHHISTRGQLNTVIDAGCGPGPAIRGFASHFKHAIGFDASAGMIDKARSIGGTSNTSEPIRFIISTAEDLGSQLHPSIPDGSVDLIIASSAAHWFDMERFWPRAAQVLKSGGSVALWTRIAARVDSCTPNYEAINTAYDELVDKHLRPYFAEGNFIERGQYVDLSLPWNLKVPASEFDQASFHREIWRKNEIDIVHDVDVITDPESWEKALGTTSPVTRWRQAHVQDIGTERDAVRMFRRTVEQLLLKAGVEPGQDILRMEPSRIVLLIVKRI